MNRNPITTLLIACLGCFTLFSAPTLSAYAENVQLYSKWDEKLLSFELHDVHLKQSNMLDAWREITEKLLIRANFYMDVRRDSDSAAFSFNQNTATGKEVLDAFITTYKAYTYTQDKATGVIWIHPKEIEYDNILNLKFKVGRFAMQLAMNDEILRPIEELMPTTGFVFSSSTGEATRNHSRVNLPPGIISVKEILNLCCVQNAIVAFLVDPGWDGLRITAVNLRYDKPAASPRTLAVRFWESEFGKTETGTPSLYEIGVKLSDSDPQKRWAALEYIRTSSIYYLTQDLIDKSDDPRKALWAAIMLKKYETMGEDDAYLSAFGHIHTNDCVHLDFGLALLTSVELAIEKKDTNIMAVLSNHKFSKAETDEIKPDLLRLFRRFPLVRDTLLGMKFEDPDLSPEGFREIEGAKLIPMEERKKKVEENDPPLDLMISS